MAQKETDLDKSITRFYEVRLTTAPSLCSYCVSRDTRAGDGRHDQNASFMWHGPSPGSFVSAAADPLVNVVETIQFDASRFFVAPAVYLSF